MVLKRKANSQRNFSNVAQPFMNEKGIIPVHGWAVPSLV